MKNLNAATLLQTAFEHHFNISPDLIIVLDNEKNIIHANQAFLKRFDEDSKGLIGKKCFQCIHQKDKQPVCCMHPDMMEDGKEHTRKVFFEKFNSWFSVKMTPLLNNQGIMVGSIHIARKITENENTIELMHGQEDTETLLQKSEDRYRSLFNNSIAVFLLIDPSTGAIVDANPAACSYYGWSHKELCDKNIAEINTLSHKEIEQEMQAAKEEKRKRFFFKHRLSGGAIRDVEVDSHPIETKGSTLLFSIVHDITDHIKAENALRENEATINAVLNVTDESILLLDNNDKLLDLNEVAAIRMGISREKAIGKKVADLLPVEVINHRKQFIEKAFITGKKVSFEDIRNNRWMVNHLYPIQNAEGKVARLAVFSRDISDRKNAEEALKINERKYRLLAENATDVIWIQDIANGAMSYLSPSIEHVLGYPLSEVMERGIDDFLTPASLQFLRNVVPERIAGFANGQRDVFTDEIEHVHKNGNKIWIEVKTQLVLNNEHGCLEAHGVARDVTDRIKTRALRETALSELHASEERLQSLFDTMMEGVIFINPDGWIEKANAAAEKILGISRPEIENRYYISPNWEIIRLDGTPMPPAEMAGPRAMQEKQPIKDVVMGVRKPDNSITWINVCAAPVLNIDGELQGVVGTFADITDQKTAEDAVNTLAVRYKILMQSASEGIHILDDHGNVVEANSAFCNMLGYTYQEIMQLNVSDWDVKLSKEQLTAKVADLMIHPALFETQFRCKNNAIRDMEISGVGIILEGRNYLYASTRDITERKQTELALTASETKFRELIDFSPVPMALYNDHQQITLLNQVFVQTFGYCLQEIPTIEAWWNEAYPDADYRKWVTDRWNEKIEYATKTGEPFIPMEVIVKCKNGTNKTVLSSATLFKNQIEYTCLSSLYDISGLKQTEEALRNALWRIETIIEGTQVGTWEWNIQTGETTYNEVWANIFGYTLDELAPSSHNTWLNLIHPEDLKQSIKHLNQYFDNECSQYDFECRMKHRDGRWIWVQDRGRLISRTSDGKPLLMYGINTDITQRKLAEEEIRLLNETLENRVAERTIQLETINKTLEFHIKEIEQFTYIASHDLQEPLRTITTFGKLIQEEFAGNLSDDANQYIDFMSNSASRMSSLLKGLLDYSLLGKVSKMEQVDCNVIVKEVLSDLSDLITVNKATIKVHELPDVYGLPAELRMLFQNLINNALKFQKKEVHPEVEISVESTEKEWFFSISDNGIGIEEKDKEKIFIIFKRMQPQTEYGGTGIGLAHCKKIAELHNGRIWVKSTPGKGSTFTFSIPR